MKHPSSRAFFAYWDSQRGDERAPYRSAIEPGPLRELLGDIVMLSHGAETGHPVRLAGTRVDALLGGDTKGRHFADLFAAESQSDIRIIISNVADELLVAVAGVSGLTADGATVHLEMLLLPLRTRAHSPRSVAGLLVPLFPGRRVPLCDLRLTSWRYLAHPPQRFKPRALRTLALARGLVVYEGLR